MYKIEKITHKDNEERLDGRYPLRKGCVVEIYQMGLSNPMILDYKKDNQRNDKTGYLKTSVVEGYSEHNDELKVYTMNSIYYFKRLD